MVGGRKGGTGHAARIFMDPGACICEQPAGLRHAPISGPAGPTPTHFSNKKYHLSAATPTRGRRRGEGEGGASTGRKPGDSECARQLHWGLDVGEVYNRDIFPVLYSEPLFFGGWVGENGGLFAPDQNGTLRRHPGPMLE